MLRTALVDTSSVIPGEFDRFAKLRGNCGRRAVAARGSWWLPDLRAFRNWRDERSRGTRSDASYAVRAMGISEGGSDAVVTR